jgi:anaerobic selenocysteine-containing dehydrogenase
MLFNALITEIAAKGWIDRDFINASTRGFDEMVAADKASIDEAAKVTGLTTDQIQKAASWIANPISSTGGADGFVENLFAKISNDVHAAKKLLSLSSFASSESDKSRVTVFRS